MQDVLTQERLNGSFSFQYAMLNETTLHVLPPFMSQTAITCIKQWENMEIPISFCLFPQMLLLFTDSNYMCYLSNSMITPTVDRRHFREKETHVHLGN